MSFAVQQRVSILAAPTQQQLIMQHPTGPAWIQVCGKFGLFPNLQQVHQYDSALRLVMSNGHEPTEEIMSCIVQEQQKHLVEQYQQAQRQRAVAMARPVLDLRSQPQQTPAAASTFAERAYQVRAAFRFMCEQWQTLTLVRDRTVRTIQASGRRACSTAGGRSNSPSAGITAASGTLPTQPFDSFLFDMCCGVLRVTRSQVCEQEEWQRRHAIWLRWKI
jgi:hypothetical protein